jgi:hypothetical protein
MIPLKVLFSFRMMKHQTVSGRDSAGTGERRSAFAAARNFSLNQFSVLSHPSQSIEYVIETDAPSDITDANVTDSGQFESRPNLSIDLSSFSPVAPMNVGGIVAHDGGLVGP